MKGKGLALIFGKPSSSKMEDEGEDEMESGENEEELDSAVEDLLSAVKSEDTELLKDALRRAIEAC